MSSTINVGGRESTTSPLDKKVRNTSFFSRTGQIAGAGDIESKSPYCNEASILEKSDIDGRRDS